jgi:pimeloyl-ACP methyl ester carboxylesterase
MPASGLDHSKPHRARVGGMEMAWIEAGEARSGEPPLVLVHGFTGHRDDFLGVLEPLVEQRRVLVPDLRGHGDSSSEPGDLGWNFDQLINDLIAFLDHLEIDRCDLLGHSMGGMLTLRLALAHPERIRSLIFMCTAPRLPESISRRGFEVGAEIAAARGMDGLQVLMEKAGRADCSDTIATWGNRYWPHHQRRLCAMTPESFHGIGRAFFDSESLVDRLPEIMAPTLVMVGEFDSDFLPGADLFEAHLPNVTRVTLPGAEHHPHQENPSAWHAALETHLDDVRDVSADVAESATRRTTA